MKLIDRQIEGVRETLEQFKVEYEKGEEWHDQSKCALCKFFIKKGKGQIDCRGCPFGFLINKKSRACVDFMFREGVYTGSGDFEDIAGFLKSLEISLMEMK